MRKKIFFITTLLCCFMFSSVCFASDFNLTRQSDDNGIMHYYKEYSDGSYEEISEDDYYNQKFNTESETDITSTESVDTVDATELGSVEASDGVITSTSVDGEVLESEEIFAGRQETTVKYLDDVTIDNFENTKKLEIDGETRFFVLLKDYYYAEITEDLYYIYTYKYERATQEAEELNEIVARENEEYGTVKVKAFLQDGIKGYTVYVRIKKYFSDEEYSYFMYDPDYEMEIHLPEGEYYIMNGGLLNDYSYEFPISTPDFVVKNNETSELYFTVGDTALPEKELEIMESQPTILEDSSIEKAEEMQAQQEEVQDESEVVEEPQDLSLGQRIKLSLQKLAPTIILITIISLVGITVYVKFKQSREEY